MHFILKIALMHTLLCATFTHGSIDSSEGISVNWIQIVPEPGKLPRHDRFKLFYDILSEVDRHSIALLRWNDASQHHPTKCNLTIETHGFDGEVSRKICNVYPPPNDDSNWSFAEQVSYLSRDRVLLTWREEHKTEGQRITSQVIFMDTCQTSEYINIETYISISLTIHAIIQHASTFDIIFSNGKVCPISYYCKLTFNHDGKQLNHHGGNGMAISAPIQRENETLTIIHVYPMDYNSSESIVYVGNKASGLEMPEVYSSIIGWTNANGLFYKNHWYSNSSGFASICWQLYKSTEFRCKWLDGTHRNQILSAKMRRNYVRITGIYNKPDGQILLLMPGYDEGTKFFVDEVQKDGRCKRLAKIPYSNGLLKRVEMSIVNRERACFSFVTKRTVNGNSTMYPITESYRFTTKCLGDLYDDTRHEFITCGQGYL